jgi:hypothetical protein
MFTLTKEPPPSLVETVFGTAGPHGPKPTLSKKPISVDPVDKVRDGFHSKKYASEIEIFTFGLQASGFRFHVAACKKAFSPVHNHAVWVDRLCQKNRPKADGLPYK